MIRLRNALPVAFVPLLFVASVAHAAVITNPNALSPGDMYYLAFVTVGTRGVGSSDIGVYDTFVNNQAALNTDLDGISWMALGSTGGMDPVDAIDHLALQDFPIFLLDGDTKIADVASIDLWNGSIDAPLNIDQHGMEAAFVPGVYTGTSPDGSGASGNLLGDIFTRTGRYAQVGGGWISFNNVSGTELRFYAFSEKLTMPEEPEVIPEPTTLVIWSLLATLGLSFYRRGRRRG